MTGTLKTVRVFISSTFPPSPRLRWTSRRTSRDMHAERVEMVGLDFFGVDEHTVLMQMKRGK